MLPTHNTISLARSTGADCSRANRWNLISLWIMRARFRARYVALAPARASSTKAVAAAMSRGSAIVKFLRRRGWIEGEGRPGVWIASGTGGKGRQAQKCIRAAQRGLDCNISLCYRTFMTEEIDRIQRALRSGMIVGTELAKAAQVHRNTLRRAVSTDWSPSAKTVQSIIKAMNEAGL